MKKLLIATLALATAAGAMAKTADELRVYINPGHGSWTPNDRPNALVGHGPYSRTNTDTLNFFESNTNLRKGFGLLEMLRAYGLKYDPTLNQEGERWQIGAARDLSNNIVMSHVKCGPYHDDNGTATQLGAAAPADLEYYNRNLGEINTEVEVNNFDMFISIHSNAATDGTATNYPLFLYRGYDTPVQEDGVDLEYQQTSKAMADACWGYAFENPHMMWSYYSATNKNIRGDINFYGSSSSNSRGQKGYLGVLKSSAPGFLVEGYFHTYQPARHRAMNWDVDYMEGRAYAHGIADFFGLTKEKTGCIYGIVRDQNERFTDTYYKPNTTTLDRFMPLNGVKVYLKKGDETVAEYTTDNYYNGAFVFMDVEPGKYTITFEAADYKAADPIEVEVKAASITYPTAQLENVNYVPPTEVYENYPDPMATNAAVGPANEYVVASEYIDEPIAQLEGKIIRRAIVRKGKMYILALDKPIELLASIPADEQAKATLLVYDLDKKEVAAEVSTEGAAGSIAAISDIQVAADGVLLACNATKNQYSDEQIEGGDAGRGTFVIYKWANDEAGLPTGTPDAWVTTQASGLWYRAYPTNFVYSGTTQEGTVVVPMPTTGATRNTRTTTISVMDGVKQSESDLKPSENHAVMALPAPDMNLFASPLADDEFLLISSTKGMQSWTFAAPFQINPPTSPEGLTVDGRADIFKYAGASYVAMPLTEGENNVGIQLVNMSKGVAGAVTTAVTLKEELPAAPAAQSAAAGEVVVTRDEFTNAVTAGWINLYLLRDSKITKLTTKNVAQPQGRKEYAYDVKAEEGSDSYAVTFNMTGDAPAASLHVAAVDGSAEFDVELGAVTKGENTATVDKSQLADNTEYAWEVRVTSEPIAAAGETFADPTSVTVRGSIVPITDPEQESFGYFVVAHGRAAGVDFYNPAGEKIASDLFKDHKMFGGTAGGGSNGNQSNPFRGAELGGKAVLTTWGDAGYGFVTVNPLDENEEPATLFAGEKQGAGHFMYNGVNLGGGTAGIDFISDGTDMWVISFSEDHEGKNGSGSTENSLVKQHMSGPWQITEAPVVLGYHSLLANTNVDVQTYGKGVFVSQVRGAGNNQTANPSFAYIADVLGDHHCSLNSGDEELQSTIDNNTAGIAISKDGKTFAAAMTGKIAIYDVKWVNDEPQLTFKYTFPVVSHDWSQLHFDAAGNLMAYLRGSGLHVYSLPDAAPVAVTAAASKYNFKGKSAIESIDAEEAADGVSVYYNLQGVKVPAESLVPGVYVKVNGQTATKVVVK